MTLDEFIAEINNGAVCACKTPEQCYNAMVFLETVCGFPICSASRYHLIPEKMHEHHGYLYPGLSERRDDPEISCWTAFCANPKIAYKDIPFDEDSSDADVTISDDDLLDLWEVLSV